MSERGSDVVAELMKSMKVDYNGSNVILTIPSNDIIMTIARILKNELSSKFTGLSVKVSRDGIRIAVPIEVAGSIVPGGGAGEAVEESVEV